MQNVPFSEEMASNFGHTCPPCWWCSSSFLNANPGTVMYPKCLNHYLVSNEDNGGCVVKASTDQSVHKPMSFQMRRWKKILQHPQKTVIKPLQSYLCVLNWGSGVVGRPYVLNLSCPNQHRFWEFSSKATTLPSLVFSVPLTATRGGWSVAKQNKIAVNRNLALRISHGLNSTAAGICLMLFAQ